jgi:serine/threonine protein kinase
VTHTPIGLRAPEQIVGDPASREADIWAFGVLVHEFVCGGMLFDLGGWGLSGSRESIDDQHLVDLDGIVGPLPESIHQRWTRSSKYFTTERVLYNIATEPYEDNCDPMEIIIHSAEERFDRGKPSSLSGEEAILIKALIRRTLQYDPAKRPSASELLHDPWFTTDFERVFSEEVCRFTRRFHQPRLINIGLGPGESVQRGT